MIRGAIICSPWSNRVCSYPGLEPKGFLAEGFSEVSRLGHTFSTVHNSSLSFHYHFFLSSLSSAMSVSLSHREREHGCFDVGFDRFVCCCIHLLCIRELTGRKMKICLRFSAWLFGGKCERTPHAFQIHSVLYLKVCACMLCMAINNKYCKVLIDWKRCGSYLLKANFFFTYPQNSLDIAQEAVILWWETPPVSLILLLL